MKFGVVGSVSKPTTTEATGGVEVWTSLFLLESIRKGHIFDLYALKGSLEIPGVVNLIQASGRGVDSIMSSRSFKQKHSNTYARASLFGVLFARIMLLIKQNEQNYDIVINSSGNPLIPINWGLYSKPLITIGHFGTDEPYVSFFEYFPLPTNIFYVFPSFREYRLAEILPERQRFHIPHGIDTRRFTFAREGGNNLLWFGRLDPGMPKGAPEAITVSNKLKIPLDLYTHVEDHAYSYFESMKPLFSEHTHFYTDKPRSEYFKNAKLFLSPLRWEEPFGLTTLEAMASGVPVVAFARGAIPEIIKDGETGFLVNSSPEDTRGDWIIKKTGIDGLCEAVEKIYAMPDREYQSLRRACREHIERNFTVTRMVEEYEAAYKKILKSS